MFIDPCFRLMAEEFKLGNKSVQGWLTWKYFLLFWILRLCLPFQQVVAMFIHLMCMLSLEETRKDSIRNEYMRGTWAENSVSVSGWDGFGREQRRDSKYKGQRMLHMELPGRMKRGGSSQEKKKLPDLNFVFWFHSYNLLSQTVRICLGFKADLSIEVQG